MTGTGLGTALRRRAGRIRVLSRVESGQALVETVMVTGMLVVIAIFLTKLIRPVLLDAFEKISKALATVGP